MTRAQLPHRNPHTYEHTCENLRALDKAYHTRLCSPLHHDNACPLHSHILISHGHD